MNASRLQISLLGEFQLLFNEQPVPGLSADRPKSLLAFLLLHRQAPQSRQHTAFLLWPDSTEGQARTNLRNLLYTLRHTLPGADDYLLVGNMTLQWNSNAAYDLDFANFEEILSSAKQASDPECERALLETAVSLYKGDLFPGNYEDWLIQCREDLREKYLEALGRLVELLEEQGDFQPAIRYGLRLWRQDVFDEPSAVQLMRLYALNGDRNGVKRVYQTLAAALGEELDIEPAMKTQDAYLQFLRLNSDQPLTILEPSSKWRPQALPLPVTPFVGRSKELADIAERLADRDCRLLSIVGLGGVGKTRVAIQAAVGHQAVFANGVAFIPLTPIQSTDLLINAIAIGLQLIPNETEDLSPQVFQFLKSKELLLVLDNVEHLLKIDTGQSVEGLLIDLLQNAPDLKILATSRQRLNLAGEWIYEIQGFPIPEVGYEDGVMQNSAVALFINGARRADNHFIVARKDIEAIVEICHLVDGMPLAIELAASWVPLLSCGEIVNEIKRSMGFLKTDLRNIPERHRSLCAVFDSTWELLSLEEKLLLVRLSQFCGLFSRESAEETAEAKLEVLSALVSKSLLQRAATGQYRLHNLVRQYAVQQRLAEYSHRNDQIPRSAQYNPVDGTHDVRLQKQVHFVVSSLAS